METGYELSQKHGPPPYLLLVYDVDAGLDVGEGVRGGKDGLPFELLVEVAVGAAIQREGCAVDKAPQVVVLVEVGDAVLHLICVEEGLHVRDLDVSLRTSLKNFRNALSLKLGLCFCKIRMFMQNLSGSIYYNGILWRTTHPSTHLDRSMNMDHALFICHPTNLVGVQFALVYRVGVLNDFHLLFTKTLPVESLKITTEHMVGGGQ